MPGWLSRLFRHDRYYTSYERSFHRLEKEETRIQARRARREQLRRRFATYLLFLTAILTAIAGAYASWIYQLPEGTFTSLGGALHSSAVLIVPCVCALMYSLTTWYLSWRDERDTRKLEHLQKERRHILKDLKDNTHFERISTLLRKYDPEEQEKAAANQITANQEMLTPQHVAVRQRKLSSPHGAGRRPHSPNHGGSSGLARSAGKVLMPMFDHLASSIMGDSPELLNELRQLRGAVSRMEETIAELSADNARLRDELGRKEQHASEDSSSQFMDHPVGSREVTKEMNQHEQITGDSDGPYNEQNPSSRVPAGVASTE